MTDERSALVEKIIKDIHNIFSKTAELYAFDIIPVDTNFKNKSPVICIENCLGLESWCVKQVYLYCYSKLLDEYSIRSQRKFKKLASCDSDTIMKLLNVTLLINPEITTLWNKRRELVQELLLDKMSELKFSMLVLSRKPKCNDAFSYRRWLLETIIQSSNEQNINPLENMINTELRICDLSSDKSPNNYHSWSHRMWLINKLKQVLKQNDMCSLYIKEFNFSERWVSKHVSDYSCFHYRQYCIKNIFLLDNSSWKEFENSLDINLRKVLIKLVASNFPKDSTVQASEGNLLSYSEENLISLLLSYNKRNCLCSSDAVLLCRNLEVLCHELVVNNELIQFYKHHEALWYHRRFIVHEIITLIYDHFGFFRQSRVLTKKSCKCCSSSELRQKQAKITRYDADYIYKSTLFQIIISHEKKFIQERLYDEDQYAGRHEKYLKFIEGLNGVL